MAEQESSARGKSLTKSTNLILSNRLWLKILIGMGLGALTGIALSQTGLALLPEKMVLPTGEWLALPGVIFLGLIQMVIIPLVVCSIILGIADSGSMDFVKRMGLRIVPYFIGTTIISITIGVLLVQTIKPGLAIDYEMVNTAISADSASNAISQKTFSELTIPQRIGNLIPSNLAQAELERNMLQIIIAAILVGIALLSIPRKTVKPLIDLCMAGQVLTMRIISWAMLLAPYAVFGLIANITIRTGFNALVGVGLYMMTVLVGLGCMMMVYLLIIRFFSGHKATSFMAGIREVQLLAFSTSSSGATMPFSIQAAEEKLGVRQEVSRFIIPLGATINMDGTALYQAIAALFLCQVFGIDLSTGQIILLVCTTVGASIGTPATPGVGIVVLATILTGIGVPAEGIGLIIGVDRILDMCRTTVNVTGDLTASVIMNKWVPVLKTEARET